MTNMMHYQLFKNKLKSVENITLTTDMWTETMSMRSFLGITGHFDICTEFVSITLGIYQSFDHKTSDHIAEMFLNSCSEWDIDVNKVSAVVTDNAASIL